MNSPSRIRAPLFALGILALLAGMWTGLVRLGWGLPSLQPAAHGPLMVSGFLGTLIGLERAIALGRRWSYAAPILSGGGGLLLALGGPTASGAALQALGSLAFVVVFIYIVRRHVALHTAVMGLGAVSWLVGNGLWLAGRPLFQVVYWWGAFLVLTIAGERLELSRLLRLTSRNRTLFAAAVGLLLAGLTLSLVRYSAGVRLTGLGFLAVALWLGRFDVARRTIRRTGLTRYMATCLLAGYLWLGISGALALSYGGVPAGPIYDAILHTLFLGFIFSMIFGHAPIILPTVFGGRPIYNRVFYLHLVLLHGSLLLRAGSDLAMWTPGRRWSSLLNVTAILLFMGTTVPAVYRAQATKRKRDNVAAANVRERETVRS